MLEYIKNEANRTYTENGARTHSTTCSDCLDLFAIIGALRSRSEQEIISRNNLVSELAFCLCPGLHGKSRSGDENSVLCPRCPWRSG